MALSFRFQSVTREICLFPSGKLSESVLVSSDFAEDMSTDSFLEAFTAVAGGAVKTIG